MSTYIADSADFTTLADAIRAKGGTNAQLSFPSGMAAAVAAISTATEPYTEVTYNASGELTNAVFHGVTRIRNYEFTTCSKLAISSIPNDITYIGTGGFNSCALITFTVLPSSLTYIGQNAFNGCTSLAITSIPVGVTSIGSNAFKGCTGLTSVTFLGRPSSIVNNVFSDCTNLSTINVPWASGAVSGAPWGATNATINYNYVDE